MDCRPSQPRKSKGEAMRRNLLPVLLLVTGVALAAQNAQHAAGVAGAPAQTGAVPRQTKEVQPKLKIPQEQAAGAQTDKKTDKKEDAQGRTEPAAQDDKDGKLTSVPGGKALGMSILGNQEAPKALVIVPWKSSDVGRSSGISPMLDDSRQPV